MRTETFCYSLICDECGNEIRTHERHAVKPVYEKSFNVPAVQYATKTLHIHLSHVHSKAKKK
jgi:hypothetical protein